MSFLGETPKAVLEVFALTGARAVQDKPVERQGGKITGLSYVGALRFTSREESPDYRNAAVEAWDSCKGPRGRDLPYGWEDPERNDSARGYRDAILVWRRVYDRT